MRELKEHMLDQNLIMGAGATLADIMFLFKTLAEKYDEFWYLKIMYDHLDLVAHVPVRNVNIFALLLYIF